MDHWILNEQGEPRKADLMTWAQWFDDVEARRVARTELANGGYVSTVFLGLDHGWGEGPPILWETMLFSDEIGEEWQERYTSREDALRGHEEMVVRAKEALGARNEDV